MRNGAGSGSVITSVVLQEDLMAEICKHSHHSLCDLVRLPTDPLTTDECLSVPTQEPDPGGGHVTPLPCRGEQRGPGPEGEDQVQLPSQLSLQETSQTGGLRGEEVDTSTSLHHHSASPGVPFKPRVPPGLHPGSGSGTLRHAGSEEAGERDDGQAAQAGLLQRLQSRQ